MASEDATALLTTAKSTFKDCSRFAIFDDKGKVLAASFAAEASELQPLCTLLDDRDEAVKRGMVIQGVRFEVHRHHPPLVYGRTMGGEPEKSEGAALCKIEDGLSGSACYGIITYQMPNISARMVPMLQSFCNQHLAAPAKS